MTKKKSTIYLEPGVSESEYKEIQKEWYEKLRKDGFEDIERLDKNGNPKDILKKDFHADFSENPDKFILTRDYYLLAGQFLNDHKWPSVLEKAIWEAHSEGKSSREIEKSLLPAKTTKTTINNILDRLRKQFKEYIKNNLPKQ